jgi:hypothetical protein
MWRTSEEIAERYRNRNKDGQATLEIRTLSGYDTTVVTTIKGTTILQLQFTAHVMLYSMLNVS